MWKYIRYSLLTLIGLTASIAMLAGGNGMWFGFALAIVLAIGGDSILGDDMSEPRYRHTWLLDLGLYANLPLLMLMTFGFAWQLSSHDLFGVGALVEQWTGYSMLAARDANAWHHYLGGALGLGLFYGVAGTNVGHELTHRTWSASAQITGRLLLAFTSDASFAIEHVYGHHKHVATAADPATAKRGENAWWFILRSTVQSYMSAWNIEAERLAKQGHSVWSWRNKMHRGNLMTLSYIAFFGWAAGWTGALAFIAVSLYGKAWLEFVNYTEHYGLVRVPGAPVEPRHSWNCNRRISGYLLYNLTRHSHHHAMGEKPFWELRAYPDTPMMPHGYLTMILFAMIPPLWNRVMIPRVLAWDKKFATPEEQPLIDAANRASGMKIFMEGLPEDQLPQIVSDKTPLPESANSDDEITIGEGLVLGNLVRGLFSESKKSIDISGSQISFESEGNETILTAALERGVAFPHNCRVGGCASCKCKLVQGEVKQLTDASYILSGEELEQGYVLACQSVPKSERVVIEVDDLPEQNLVREIFKTGATISNLKQLTHDIIELTLKLDGPIAYTAGQYADLSVPGLIDEPRSYSFANEPGDASEMVREVSFHIRHVPGGEFTTWLHEEAKIGDRLSLKGPYGDFWLRPAGAPILAIAGGSGLAPVKALLEQARTNNAARDVLFLFGARTQEDLYMVEELQQLARSWRARMDFVPVLSHEPEGSDWEGLRGMVTDHIRSLTGARLAEHHAYMCGPPAMIDAAEKILTHAAVRDGNIHYDKFLDKSHLHKKAESFERSA